MSSKYKPGDTQLPHFVTFTVVGWIDVFSREAYKDIIVDSLKFCIEKKGLCLHAWVIMTNHIHLILSSNTNRINHIVRDLKKYTSKQIIQAIKNNPSESRKGWMINIFGYTGRNNNDNKDFQFWLGNYHPVELYSSELLRQRMVYLHENPVKAGLVWEPWHYKYSSAIDYYTNEHGLINIDLL